jgi:hypothetical protein
MECIAPLQWIPGPYSTSKLQFIICAAHDAENRCLTRTLIIPASLPTPNGKLTRHLDRWTRCSEWIRHCVTVSDLAAILPSCYNYYSVRIGIHHTTETTGPLSSKGNTSKASCNHNLRHFAARAGKTPEEKRSQIVCSARANARGGRGQRRHFAGPTPDAHSAKAQERVSRSVTVKNEGRG